MPAIRWVGGPVCEEPHLQLRPSCAGKPSLETGQSVKGAPLHFGLKDAAKTLEDSPTSWVIGLAAGIGDNLWAQRLRSFPAIRNIGNELALRCGC